MMLMTTFYHDLHPDRRGEFLECLRRNVENDLIEEVHLFVEESHALEDLKAAYPLLADARVNLHAHGRRITYAELFTYANRHFAGRRVIIANADIYFDRSLARLEGHDLANMLLCLSRWDVLPGGGATLFERADSQDAWIFEAPIRDIACDFQMGVPACDNRLAWEAQAVGLEISNPSRSLRAFHLHLSGVRRYNWSERLDGPLCGVPPVFLPGDAPLDWQEDGAQPAIPEQPAIQAQPSRTIRPGSTGREVTFALTSLSPSAAAVDHTRACIASWRAAGLEVRAFNHPDEISRLAELYDVEFVPVSATTEHVFGRPFVPISAMLDWAVAQHAPVLLINADIKLAMAEWEIKRLRWLSDGGLCYFIRYNQASTSGWAYREEYGIDAFLFHGRDAARLPESFLSMGQPFWDYWLPHAFAARDLPIYTVEFPAAFHRNHEINWSWENWHRCALEFVRITGEPCGTGSFDECGAMSVRVRHRFDSRKTVITRRPPAIRDWVVQHFDYPGPKTFLELGAHRGTDTAWMSRIPGVRIHAFEPDPRNQQPARDNVILNRAAVADHDGPGSLILSTEAWGQEWTHSSSIKQPLNHLERFPVGFGEAIPVELVALDTYSRTHALGTIDFIWADIQGAEGEMIRGGLETLAHTRYLYTEYSDDEMYEGQAPLKEILAMLPGFRVLELWPDDVLLINRAID